jgi:hypothetical protein
MYFLCIRMANWWVRIFKKVVAIVIFLSHYDAVFVQQAAFNNFFLTNFPFHHQGSSFFLYFCKLPFSEQLRRRRLLLQ